MKSVKRYVWKYIGILVSVVVLAATPILTFATTSEFVPASMGCSMAHCTPVMSGAIRVPPPTGSVSVLAHDTIPTGGTGLGLGCSSNTSLVVCTYNLPTDNVVAYNASGTRLWTTGSMFDANVNASAAMIDASGNVIIADDHSVARFNSSGTLIWQTATPGGIPISPIVTAQGVVVLATQGGPISAFDSSSGKYLGDFTVKMSGSSLVFDTINTPCTINNRIYVSMQQDNDPLNTGWLVALDINDNTFNPITQAWEFTFKGPSGASPLCINNNIYFDGDGVSPSGATQPTIFGVHDNGTSGSLLWSQPALARILAAFMPDPRGGFWDFPTGYYFELRSLTTGAVMDTINPTSLIPNPPSRIVPSATMMLTGTTTDPVMITGLIAISKTATYAVAIDLPSHSALWNVNVGADQASGQFPIVLDSSGNPEVVFNTFNSGAYFVGVPH